MVWFFIASYLAAIALGIISSKFIFTEIREAEAFYQKLYEELHTAVTNDDRQLRNSVIRILAAIKERI